MNHKTAPWWNSKHRNYRSNIVAWIHHRPWEYRVENNSICIRLDETHKEESSVPWLKRPDQSQGGNLQKDNRYRISGHLNQVSQGEKGSNNNKSVYSLIVIWNSGIPSIMHGIIKIITELWSVLLALPLEATDLYSIIIITNILKHY